MALPALTLGCDPELFLTKDNNFLSAFGIFKGTKEEPTPLQKGAVQVDGMALEFNIDPAGNIEEFVGNIGTVIAQIRQQMEPDINFDYSSTVHLNEDYLRQRSQEEVELGCDPDFNAWTGDTNEAPDGDRPMRTAGGHVHIGYGTDIVLTETMSDVGRKIIKLCDIFMGIPSVLIDKDNERREMYGKAGAFRFKPYGVEYRSLSNFWIKSEVTQRWVFQQAELAYMSFFDFDDIMEKIKLFDVQSIINTSDVDAAKQVIKILNIELPKEE